MTRKRYARFDPTWDQRKCAHAEIELIDILLKEAEHKDLLVMDEIIPKINAALGVNINRKSMRSTIGKGYGKIGLVTPVLPKNSVMVFRINKFGLQNRRAELTQYLANKNQTAQPKPKTNPAAPTDVVIERLNTIAGRLGRIEELLKTIAKNTSPVITSSPVVISRQAEQLSLLKTNCPAFGINYDPACQDCQICTAADRCLATWTSSQETKKEGA